MSLMSDRVSANTAVGADNSTPIRMEVGNVIRRFHVLPEVPINPFSVKAPTSKIDQLPELLEGFLPFGVALRIGRSIHFPQVADLRSRHCNRTLGMAESCRKVVSSPPDYRC
ncbi:MAG: hypothetical protein JW384_04004 [Nitrosomonadaceae bacterium]|nr:hypothetical protein [Nitrosomonadaceae bacterium]